MAALAVRPTTAEAPFASGGHWAAPALEPTALQRHRDKPRSRTAAHSNLLRRHRARTREPPKPPSAFKKAYDEGLLPLRLCYDRLQNGRSVNGRSIGWTVTDVLSLDYDHYCLLFCEGLTETQEPLGFLAAEGLSELLQEGGPAHRCASLAQRLAPPLKHALRSPNQTVAKRALEAVVQYVTCDAREKGGLGVCGQALPIESIAPAVDACRRRHTSLRFDCADVLGTLERNGGPEALKRIKRGVLAYESVL